MAARTKPFTASRRSSITGDCRFGFTTLSKNDWISGCEKAAEVTSLNVFCTTNRRNIMHCSYSDTPEIGPTFVNSVVASSGFIRSSASEISNATTAESPLQKRGLRVQNVQQRLQQDQHHSAVDQHGEVASGRQRQQKSDRFQELLPTHIICHFKVLETAGRVGEENALCRGGHGGRKQAVLDDATKLGDIGNEGINLGFAAVLEEEANGAVQVEGGQLR